MSGNENKSLRLLRELKHSDAQIREATLLDLAARARQAVDLTRFLSPGAASETALRKQRRDRHKYRPPPPEIFARIVRLLSRDSHTRVRRAAAMALGMWGRRGASVRGAEEALLENLERFRGRHRQPKSTFVYLRALIDVARPGAGSADRNRLVGRFLFDEDETIRMAAGFTLACIGDYASCAEILRESIALDFRARDRAIDNDGGARQSMIALGRLAGERHAREALDFLCEHIVGLHRAHPGALSNRSQYPAIFAWLLTRSATGRAASADYSKRFFDAYVPHRELLSRYVRQTDPVASPETQSLEPRLRMLAAMTAIAHEVLIPLWDAHYSEDYLPFELLQIVERLLYGPDRNSIDRDAFFPCKPNQWCTPESFAACWAIETVGEFARAVCDGPETRRADDARIQRFLNYIDRAVLNPGAGLVPVAGSEKSTQTIAVPAFGGGGPGLFRRREALRIIARHLRRANL